MKTRVLILGATGYVGRRLAAALHASDWAEPVAATRRKPVAGGDIETVFCEATDTSSLTQAAAGVDALVNCVAGSAEAMVATARAMAEVQASRSRPLRIVHFSSMAVYGDAVGRVDEDHPFASLPAQSYGGAKIQAEALLADVPQVGILRPGCIYGAGSPQWTERIVRLLRARRLGDLGPAGDGCSNLVHVDDVVAAAAAVLQRGADGAFNLAMAGAPNWNVYFMRLARAMGAVPVRRVTARRLKLEGKVLAPPLKILEIAGGKAGLRGLPPVISPALLRLWQQDIRLDVRRAEQVLGMQWTTLETGLAESLASRPGQSEETRN
ncbi:NAD-dependent epimerase/dehydratase family protein [Pigmentiphaga sp. YJ18]|uniref:NAD-dependent epimerase/dehydratase family protein n=1 Tax=Pigmentiphaga sp. YJ18 TaxID=3134907 RepID=UPI003115F40D